MSDSHSYDKLILMDKLVNGYNCETFFCYIAKLQVKSVHLNK